jgi:CPA2 family monovalent cation:H+ antiporter-2
VILIGIVFVASGYLHPFISNTVGTDMKGTVITIVLSLVLMAPFLYALGFRRIEKKAYSHLWLNKRYSRGPLIAIEILRIALSVFFVGFLLNIFLETWLAVGIAGLIIALVIMIFSQKLQAFYNRLETRFLLNLNERDSLNRKPDVGPWEAHLAELEVSPESTLVGQTLAELAIRERYGVNIARIERGKLAIPVPGSKERLYPHDKLTVIGTDDQLASVKQLVEVETLNNDEIAPQEETAELQKVVITTASPVFGKSIRESKIREQTEGLVIGIERRGERIVNPDSAFVFQAGDIVWIVGNKKRINKLIER